MGQKLEGEGERMGKGSGEPGGGKKNVFLFYFHFLETRGKVPECREETAELRASH